MSLSEKLIKYFNENEMHEIEDILEIDSNPLLLIESNIEYAFKNLFENNEDEYNFGEDTKITKINSLLNPEYAGDKEYCMVMGNYEIIFNDDSSFKGVVISRFNILNDNKYELLWLTIGDEELKHFGNEEPLEKAPWDK